MTKILIKCRNIFIGDILFAGSVARKLKDKYEGRCEIHFDLNYMQPLELMLNNPWIDKVFYMENEGEYDKEYVLIESLDPLDPYEKKPAQFQRMCGIDDIDGDYEIFTNKALDYSIEKSLNWIESNHWGEHKKVCYQVDWEQKSFLFTKEEYELAEGGEDGLGYGGSLRCLADILKPLEESDDMIILAVGLETKNVTKEYPAMNSTSRFTFTASLLKNVDYMVGAEGCLTNISAALGTPTIITTDYIYQMFGPKGISWQQEGGDLNKLEERTPQLGPLCYYPSENHVHLSPYLTDEEVGSEILEIVL